MTLWQHIVCWISKATRAQGHTHTHTEICHTGFHECRVVSSLFHRAYAVFYHIVTFSDISVTQCISATCAALD
jgi:hypothetical protein